MKKKNRLLLNLPFPSANTRKGSELQSALIHTRVCWKGFSLTMRQMSCKQIAILVWTTDEGTGMQTKQAPYDHSRLVSLMFLPVLKCHKGQCIIIKAMGGCFSFIVVQLPCNSAAISPKGCSCVLVSMFCEQ